MATGDGRSGDGRSGDNRPRGVLPTAVPPDALIPMRSPHAPRPGEQIPSHYRWCFGCGSDHPTGLHLSITAGEGLTAHGRFLVTDDHQGAPGLAHGGLLTTAIDEMLGALNWLLTSPAVTGRLECDFRRPVPVGSVLYLQSEVVGVKGRKVFTKAVGWLDDPQGPMAISAAGLFVQVPLEHFVKNSPKEYIDRAIADRAAGGPAWRPEPDSGMEINP